MLVFIDNLKITGRAPWIMNNKVLQKLNYFKICIHYLPQEVNFMLYKQK